MKWWQEAVVYQVYPRSFMDSNNDGIGDLQGIISKLDYILDLGANVIWLSPVYESPNDDNGYDISDYYSVMAEFGTMEDMEELIKEASQRGIKIVMDLVANHTSTSHKWFQKALEDKKSKYHEYYYFFDNTGSVPNDIQSVFLGSAWEETPNRDEVYLHMFAKSQADLNWHNSEVREELYKMINWWLEKGIGGFRLDVIDYIAKEVEDKIITDGPKLHEYICEMTEKTFSNYDVMTVGETWSADTEKAIKYSNLDGSELSMIFNFSHILLDMDGNEKWDYKKLNLLDLKINFEERQQGLFNKGWDALFWNNHDLPRIVSRWGDDKQWRVESAKMFGTLLHFMQGTPYVYQGEELGMTNVEFQSIDDFRDIEIFNMYQERIQRGCEHSDIMKSIHHIGRDNARTPMQWNSEDYGGFSKVKPWIGMNENYKTINAQAQYIDANSIYNYYKKLIGFRRTSEYREIIRDGRFELIDKENKNVFVYKRIFGLYELVVICNFRGFEVEYTCDELIRLNHKKIVLSNYSQEMERGYLKPYEAKVVYGQIKYFEDF